jgi:hypothetical protein
MHPIIVVAYIVMQCRIVDQSYIASHLNPYQVDSRSSNVIQYRSLLWIRDRKKKLRNMTQRKINCIVVENHAK